MALDPTTLAQLLAGEVAILSGLASVLNREQAALAMINSEELEEIAPEKSKLLDEVAQAVWARDALLAAHGYTGGDHGLQAARELDPGIGKACGPLWDEISRLALECQEINRVNGVILHQLASRTSNMIASLLGPAAPSSPYGSS